MALDMPQAGVQYGGVFFPASMDEAEPVCVCLDTGLNWGGLKTSPAALRKAGLGGKGQRKYFRVEELFRLLTGDWAVSLVVFALDDLSVSMWMYIITSGKY